MNRVVKLGLLIGAGFLARKLYEIYKVGEEVTYTPTGVKFKKNSLNSYSIIVGIQLYNPTTGEISMKDVSGTLAVNGSIISTFSSGAFKIKRGMTDFPLTFNVSSVAAITAITTAKLKNQPLRLDVVLNKNLGLITKQEKFSFGKGDLPETSSIIFG
jgi:hypothetical protein